MISATTWERLAPELERAIEQALAAQRALLQVYPALRAEERDDARREGLRAQRAMLASLLSDGVLSEHVYSELVGEVDAALLAEPAGEQ
jgi:hypothetical protein